MKTICIYHSRDLDGWMSGAIVKAAYSLTELYGWDYGKTIPDLSIYDKVVMVDISFPKEVMQSITNKLIWIDHHISAIKDIALLDPLPFIEGLRNDKFAACELTWKYFFEGERLPEIVRLLGRYDCFGHKGTDEEQKVLEFQYAARSYWKSVDDCYKALKQEEHRIVESFSEIGKGIYKYLCTEAEQAYANRFLIVLDGYYFACVNKERFNPINFGINYHNDKATDNYWYDGFACFWYANGRYNYSLYNDNGQVDCSVIAKNRGGGGHKGASGFITDQIILQ
jgi:oligoribonuclease NrnB/cAMP/cGMP phosphodiesterase (DHH superfamily)